MRRESDRDLARSLVKRLMKDRDSKLPSAGGPDSPAAGEAPVGRCRQTLTSGSRTRSIQTNPSTAPAANDKCRTSGRAATDRRSTAQSGPQPRSQPRPRELAPHDQALADEALAAFCEATFSEATFTTAAGLSGPHLDSGRELGVKAWPADADPKDAEAELDTDVWDTDELDSDEPESRRPSWCPTPWRPAADNRHWLGDPESWKPDAELDVVKLFREEDSCACGGPIKNWRVDRAEHEVRFNCANPDCTLGAWSPDDDFLGSFGGWDDDPDGDGDIPVMLAF